MRWKDEIKRLVELLLATDDLRKVKHLTVNVQRALYLHIEQLQRELAGTVSNEQVKVIHGLLDPFVHGPVVAPGIARTIIGANSHRLGYPLLDQGSFHRKTSPSVFQQHGGTTRTGTKDVYAASTQVNEITRRSGRRDLQEAR